MCAPFLCPLYGGAEYLYAQLTQRAHDNACQQHAAHAGQHAFLEVHVQQTGGQRTCPCAGTRQGDAHKQQQRPVQAAARLFCSFCPACSPFTRQKEKNRPITGLSLPHTSTLRAKK